MKTIEDVKKEQAELKAQFNGSDLTLIDGVEDADPRGISKARKRMTLLKEVVLYLESNPNKEFVESEQAKISERIRKIKSEFPAWKKAQTKEFLQSMTETKQKSKYHLDMGLKTLNSQLQTLNYILS